VITEQEKISGFYGGVLDVSLLGHQDSLEAFLVFLIVEKHRVKTFWESDHSHKANEQYTAY
jgi:hypothetical protein